jgi:Ser/Thr protein kinase RdoA (MazF antagonist)
MVSQLSEALDIVACLRECARGGDWETTAELTNALPRTPLAADAEEIGEYLGRLKEALKDVRVARTRAATSLVRVSAAARFNQSGNAS